MLDLATTLVATATLLLIAGSILRRRRRRRAPDPDPESLRSTAQGPVVGFAERPGLHAWLGIPYAEAPLGSLRWRAPRPARPWSGTRTALQFGPKPMQIAGLAGDFPRRLYGQPAGSEDCLYLNVWAPRAAPAAIPQGEARLPVMVWIYGGGNAAGAANVSLYDPAYLATKHRAVIVSFNYRLGVFGWFVHPDVFDDEATEEDRSGNFGTLDVVAALRWVQTNIAAFGGDPGNVTVFGESAGGINVMSLLLCPQARGLFHRAIAQSSIIAPYTVGEAANYVDDVEPGHRNSSREIVNKLLVRDARAAARDEAKALQDRMRAEELRDYLYGKRPEELLSVFDEVLMGMYMNPRPIADGHVLPLPPWHDAYADASRCSGVPLILGTNRDEFRVFMASDAVEYIDLRVGRIPRIRDPERYAREGRYQSDLWKASSVDEIAERMSAASRSAVFAYRFDWDDWPTLPGLDLKRLVGAGHGTELMFLFGSIARKPWLRLLLGPRRYAGIVALTEAVTSYWVHFARTGDPGGGADDRLVRWQRWSNAGQEGRVLVIDEAQDGGIRMSDELVTVEGIKARLVADPATVGNEHELARLYARLFVYGLHGNTWDRAPFAALADLAPGGARRARVEECRPSIVP